MGALIRLDEVSFSAQNRTVVRDISCQFEEGKTTALVGPSGSGKSTLLKLSAGLLIPSRGRVSFRDRDIARMNREENLEFRRTGAVVFQDSALWANQSLYQGLELPLRVHFPRMDQAGRQTRIREVLQEAGYQKDVSIRPSMLSMGEQKLIAFARALVCRPSLLFLDEWTESLDDGAARRLTGLVKDRQALGHTVIFVSHDFKVIRDMADHIFMMLEGQIFLKLTREQLNSDDDLARYVAKGIAP